MAIIGLQRRLREIGRIRLGETRQGRDGPYPAKLTTFRLTAPDRAVIDAAADHWGGKVEPWAAPSGRQWQVVTETDTLGCVVPTADMAFSQWYELWSGGGCQRRCDGRTELLSDGPCLCDPADRECAPTSRLNVLLTDLPGLGMWRVESHGWNAAVELAGVVAVLAAASDQGQFLPARLRVEERAVKRPGKDGKPETHRFVVPVLDLGLSLLSLGKGQGGAATSLGQGEPAAQPQAVEPPPPGQLGQPEQPEQPEVGAKRATAGQAPRTVKDQVADLASQTGRVLAVDLPPDTGVEPATAEQTEAGVTPDDRPPEPPPPASTSATPEAGGTAPRSHTDPETMRRRIMVQAKETWPDRSPEERDDLRHALGIVATYTSRAAAGEPPQHSVSHMDMAERTRLLTLMDDVKHGRMVIEPADPDPQGHRRFRSWIVGGSGKVATLTRRALDDWDVSVTTTQGDEP